MSNPIRLLVIEDDVIDQRAIKRALASSFLDVDVDYTFDLEETEKLSQSKEWDLVLTDYHLPLSSGIEILKYFKEVKKIDVPILVMTGMSNESIASEAMANGAFDFLTKNLITPEGIGLAIRNALRVASQQKETNQLLADLKRSEKQLRETQKIAGLGSWELNVNNRVIKWTAESASIVGLVNKYILPLDSFWKQAIPEDREELRQTFDVLIEKGIGFEKTFGFYSGNGNVSHVSMRGEPNLEKDEVSSIRGTVIDVSKQKAIELHLTEAKLGAENLAKLKQDFLANMSHEIRTPMNAILGFADIALNNELNDDVRGNVEKIKQSGENLLVIINDILDFTKIETGQLDVEHIEFDLIKVLDSVKDQLENSAKSKRVRLIFDVESDVPRKIEGDPVRLGQVLTNLLNNAVKFTEKGFVEVRIKRVSGSSELKLQFEIEDTGIGIPKSKQSEIFESFTQASSDTTRKFGGTGLGLSICKKLVELLGGEISVTSEENVGSTFVFTILTKACEDHAVAEQKKQVESISLEGVSVLLVEDNMMNRELAIHFLKEWGVNYDYAENGREGVRKVTNNEYDVILMDLSMPEMDGYEATKKIRLIESSNRYVPIMAMTANAFTNDVEKCFEVGMNDHISKPFKADVLKEKIYNLAFNINAKQFSNNKVGQTLNPKEKQQKLYSLDLLEEMGGGDLTFIEEMINIYITESPKTLLVLDKAVKNWKVNDIKSAAHKLRSPSALMGIKQAAELAEFIEANVLDEEKSDSVKLAAASLIEIVNKAMLQAKELYH